MQSMRLVVDPMQSLDFSLIGPAYMGIGPEFDRSGRMIVIANFTDATLLFSWNGVDDHFPLVKNTHFILTITQNNEDTSEYYALPAGSRLYVKELETPTLGTIYVTQFRGEKDA